MNSTEIDHSVVSIMGNMPQTLWILGRELVSAEVRERERDRERERETETDRQTETETQADRQICVRERQRGGQTNI